MHQGSAGWNPGKENRVVRKDLVFVAYVSTCPLVWPQLWNFIERRVKFNAFLHSNEDPERICLYQFEAELAKIGHFRFQSQFLRSNMTQSSWDRNCYLNIKLGEQFSLKAFIFSTILAKLYLVKKCPIFTRAASNCHTR